MVSTVDFTEFNGVRKVSVITRTSGLAKYLDNVTNTGVISIFVTDVRGFVVGDVIGIGTTDDHYQY